MKRLLALGFGLVTAIAAVFLTLKLYKLQHKVGGDPHRHETTNNERDTPIARPVDGNHPAGHHDDRHEEKSYRLDKMRFIFEILAVAVVFAYTIIQGHQLGVIRDQEKRQLRAYVGLLPTEVRNFGPNSKVIFDLEMKNTGLTPAYAAHGGGVVGVFPYPLPHGYEGNWTLDIKTEQSRSAIFPNGSQGLHTEIHDFLTPDQTEAIRAGSAIQLYVLEIVYYRDVFGDKHWTRTCSSVGGQNLIDAINRKIGRAHV